MSTNQTLDLLRDFLNQRAGVDPATVTRDASLQAVEIDPACEGVRHVAGAALPVPQIEAALTNSFAFGGSNAVLAFRRVSA